MSNLAHTEKRVLRAPRAVRNIEIVGRSFGLTREQFASELEGKIVLDIGSCYNGLAIDAILRNVRTTIISSDPIRNQPDFEDRQKAALSDARQQYFPEFDPESIERARIESLKRTYSHYAHSMPSFKNGQFDLLVDHIAVFAYFQEEVESLAFLRTLKEERRVSATDAKWYVCDIEPYSQGSWKSWKEILLEKAGFNYEIRTACSMIFTNPGKASEILLP